MIERRMFRVPGMVWRNPLTEEMERIKRDMSKLTKAMFSRPELPFPPSRVFPAVNITEDKDRYYVRAELPGIKSDEIDVQVDGRNLAISGERKIQSEGENARYHRREREAGKFSRVIGLPGDINADKVNAEMDNGVLTIAIDKAEAAKPRQISVN